MPPLKAIRLTTLGCDQERFAGVVEIAVAGSGEGPVRKKDSVRGCGCVESSLDCGIGTMTVRVGDQSISARCRANHLQANQNA